MVQNLAGPCEDHYLGYTLSRFLSTLTCSSSDVYAGQIPFRCPSFQIPCRQGLQPLTDSVARKHLKGVSNLLGLPRSFTFHDFRQGVASWAFVRGVPVQETQIQGTWSSNCVWRYISPPPSYSSQVSQTFRSHLST